MCLVRTRQQMPADLLVGGTQEALCGFAACWQGQLEIFPHNQRHSVKDYTRGAPGRGKFAANGTINSQAV